MRQKTVRKLRTEAIAEMAQMGIHSPSQMNAKYPSWNAGGIRTGYNASNPYKNFIRNYRRENR